MQSEEILRTEYSEDFDNKRKNRMVVSFYKYGHIRENYGNCEVDAVKTLKERLSLYEKTGNTEWLVDVANMAMIEFMYPQHPQAHFRATGSEESPGLRR
jgi:hypothetical protein